ncbi:MAG: PD40 domain-containing protein [Phycisphaerales bacterium]|nr:PD40 domain-containing protein [Phycisphaerales bacterium]
MVPFVLGFTLAAASPVGPGETLEAPLLRDHVQLTFDRDFVKAGESYFSPNARWVIFQAVPVPPGGERPNPHYSMYAAPVQRNAQGHIVGLGRAILLSPPGSAATCGWFHPTEPGVAIMGCTWVEPSNAEAPGYQRAGSRYAWSFPREMDIFRVSFDPAVTPSAEAATTFSIPPEHVQRLVSTDGYSAECSYSPDGRYVLYAQVNPEAEGKPDADIWMLDTRTGRNHLVVAAPGYDGGPFFSPDGRSIVYRSDRRGDDRLQVFLAELEFDESGTPRVAREIPLTDNDDVNWAPYFHPSGKFLVFTSSAAGHMNYEVFSLALDAPGAETTPPARRARRRVTFAEGFDGLPAFSPDGSWMIWTSQRGSEGADGSIAHGSSQLWAARVAEPDEGAWTAPLTREQAIAIARETALAELGAEAEGLSWDAAPFGRSWTVQGLLGGTSKVRYAVDPLGLTHALGLGND